MRFQTALSRCRRPLAWFPIVVAIVVACVVANQQAKAEPARAVQAAAPFISNRLSVEVIGTGPDVILIAVGGSRHFIMADQPARFDAIVDAFLK